MHYYHYYSLSKQLTVAHSLHHNAGYYSVFSVFEPVFASSALPYFELVFVGFPATIFAVEKQ